MSETDEKMKLEKITKLLEKGGTMLANHHDCGAPMFRYQGKIICPVCESVEQTERKTVARIETRAETRTETKPQIKEPETRQEKRMGLEKRGELSKAGEKPIEKPIRDNIMNKVMDLAESLDNEQDLQRIRDKFACIEQGIKILRLLENPS
jgi:UPF0148 protein